MKILGLEWPDSTFGQKESASSEGKHGEKTTSTVDRQLETASEWISVNHEQESPCLQPGEYVKKVRRYIDYARP